MANETQYQWEMGFTPLEQVAWRKTTKSSRMEIDVGMLGRGKVIWNFQSLAESGGIFRQTGNVKIFMDLQDVDTLIFRLKTGYNPEKYGGVFWKSKPMGTPAANLKESRGGCAEYREMTIKVGSKAPLAIYAMKCDGKQNERGLIMPVYSNNAPQNRTGITIGMEKEEMISLISTLERELLAYRTSQYILAGMQQDYAYEDPSAQQAAHTAATPAQTSQKQEPTKSEQTKPEQSKTEQAKPEQTKSEQTKSKQTKAAPSKTEQAKSEQSKDEPVKAERQKSKSSKPKSADEGFSWEDVATEDDKPAEKPAASTKKASTASRTKSSAAEPEKPDSMSEEDWEAIKDDLPF